MYDAKQGMVDSGYQPGAGDGDHGAPVRRIGSGAKLFSAAMWVVISASEMNRQFQYFWDKFDDQRILGVIKDHNLY